MTTEARELCLHWTSGEHFRECDGCVATGYFAPTCVYHNRCPQPLVCRWDGCRGPEGAKAGADLVAADQPNGADAG